MGAALSGTSLMCHRFAGEFESQILKVLRGEEVKQSPSAKAISDILRLTGYLHSCKANDTGLAAPIIKFNRIAVVDFALD